MENIIKFIFVWFLAFFPLMSAGAALNVYTSDNAAGPASVEIIDPSPTTVEGRSKTKEIDTSDANNTAVYPEFEDKLIDMRDAEPTPPAAGPALLEIEPIRGESPESEAQEGVIQYNESDLDFAQKNTISAEAREIRGWDEKKKSDFLETVKEHSQVKSGQELENFAQGVLLKDENVKSIQADEEKVKIEYEMPARFLNIFNASLVTRAEVTYGGSVKITYPWYAFLFKKLIAEDDLKSEAEANLPEVGDEVLVSFETRALAIRTLSNIMKTKHDTVKNSIGNMR